MLAGVMLASGSVALTGCGDSLFSDAPMNTISENTVWQNSQLLDEYVNTWYRNMNNGFNIFVPSTIALVKSASRYYMPWFGDQISVGKADWYNAGYGDLLKGNETEISAWARLKWSTYYGEINNINTLLEKQGEITDGEHKQRVLGEAHFMRAYYYYMLWRYYGAPLLIDHTYSPIVKEEKFPRATYKQMVDFIAAEADKAAALLPVEYDAQSKGRATRGAAIMLKAKAYLWASSPVFQNKEKDYLGFTDDQSAAMLSGAKDAYEELFGLDKYDLVKITATTQDGIRDEYRKIFLTKNSQESIFEVQHSDDGNFANGFGHKLDRESCSPFFTGTVAAYTPTQNHVDEYEMQQGYTFDATHPYDHRDYRFYANVLYDGAKYRGHEMDMHSTVQRNWNNTKDTTVVGVDLTPYGTSTSAATTLTGYYLGKFVDETQEINDNDTYASKQNYIIWRLAEAYLDYAEVLFRMGLPDAEVYVNKVRTRAHMWEKSSVTWDDIVKERRVEMAFEETTYWDLLRWGVAVDRMNGKTNPLKKVTITLKNGVYTYKYANVNRFPTRVRVFTEKQYYLPIPWAEIKYHGVEQNPEWNEV